MQEGDTLAGPGIQELTTHETYMVGMSLDVALFGPERSLTGLTAPSPGDPTRKRQARESSIETADPVDSVSYSRGGRRLEMDLQMLNNRTVIEYRLRHAPLED